MENDTLENKTHIAVSAATWHQIDTLAAQIASPTVQYNHDQLTMANEAIEDQRRRAELIRKLVPEGARNCF